MKKIDNIIARVNSGDLHVVPTELMFTAFKQGTVHLPPILRIGGGGNCASVAVIKSAIATFGFNVFRSIIVDQPGQRYLIDLRDDDDSTYSVSFANYEFASERSAFALTGTDEISSDIYEFAKFCFSVMAEVKRLTFRRRQSYVRSVNDLNKGESAEDIFEFLGVSASQINDLSLRNLSKIKNLVVWNKPHAVFCSEGNYDEFFKGYEGKLSLGQLQIIHGDGSDEYKPVGAYSLS